MTRSKATVRKLRRWGGWILLAMVVFVVLPATVLASEVGRRYDADRSGYIGLKETRVAVGDYFDDALSLEDARHMVGLYFGQEFVTFAVPDGREFEDTQQFGLYCTGSMAPTLTCLDAGTLALDVGPDDIVPDSIISFAPPDCFEEDGHTYIHRVIEVLDGPDGQPVYVTQGDALREADPCPVPYANVVGLVIDTTYDVYPANAGMYNATKAAWAAHWAALDSYREAKVVSAVAGSDSEDVHARYAQRYEELCGVPLEFDETCYSDDAARQELDGLWDAYLAAWAVYEAAWKVEVIRYPVHIQEWCNLRSQYHRAITGETVIVGECVGRDWVNLSNAATAYAERYEELCGAPPGESDDTCALGDASLQELDDLWVLAEARYDVYVARDDGRTTRMSPRLHLHAPPNLPEQDPPRPEEPTLSEVIEQVRPSVVKIWNGGQGSGVIFDTAGETAYILTVSHVVDDRHEEIIVRVEDETYYIATLLRRDPVRDLAVVTICCGEFTTADFGDYDDVKVGDDLIVMGYPRGGLLRGPASVTKGIVSNKVYALSRDIRAIQTDAATNPGSSGGPYLTMDGEIVAVAYSEYHDSEGLHFGIAEPTITQHMSELTTPGGEAIFENISGQLYHDPDSPTYRFAEFLVGNGGAADIEVEADFVNPYAFSDHEWSHGLAVRTDPDYTDDVDLPYLAFVIDGSRWAVYRVDWWIDTGSFVRLARGTANTIKTGADARNRLKVSASGPVGDFYINGVLVHGDLDLGSAIHSGNIAVFEGIYQDDEREDAVTVFEDLGGKLLE